MLRLFCTIRYSSSRVIYFQKWNKKIIKLLPPINPTSYTKQYRLAQNKECMICPQLNKIYVDILLIVVYGRSEQINQNNNIIMQKHPSQEQQECFVTTQNQNQHHLVEQSDTVDIGGLNQQIRKSLPRANELIHYHRPKQMKARVLSIQSDIQKLPPQLDQPCTELDISTSITNPTHKPKLQNKQKLSLSEYLNRKQFTCLYTKYMSTSTAAYLQMSPLKQTINQMTVRLRTVCQVSDYNCKEYKEISQYRDKCRERYRDKDRDRDRSIRKIVQNVNQQSNQCFIQQQIEQHNNDAIDSNFQCGNLAKVYTCSSTKTYYLLLEQDTNTHGYTNWFFYRVRNQSKGVRKFYILNMIKRTSFYRQGMKISIFSKNKYYESQIKWFKGGNNTAFFQTNFMREQHSDYFNCLYFQYDFEYEDDEVYFAASQPYTYTRLANLMNSIQKSSSSNNKIGYKCQTIGYSVSNNIIPAITIFMKNQTKYHSNNNNKKTIVILGRQHPSEMAGSFISEFIMKAILEESQQAQILLSKFNVLVIPMVNPDGVIYGNSRSNLTGFDLNRHWGPDAIKQLTPQTHKIRSYLSLLQKPTQSSHSPSPSPSPSRIPSSPFTPNNSIQPSSIQFLLDLHGHGKKLNTFLFCCKKQDRISNRQFPLILSKFQQRFQLISCTYGISRDKENTVRAQLHDIGIQDCYTLENSYYGYVRGRQKDKLKDKDGIDKQKQKDKNDIISYNQNDYKNIAESILKSLCVFFSNTREQKQTMKQKFGWNIDSINEQLSKIVDKLQRYQKNVVEDEDLMSESQPQADGLKLEERLKVCTNSKVLDKKIRQSYRKSKISNDKNKSKKSVKNTKNEKMKTQPAFHNNDDDNEQQDIRLLQKKIEGKLILSKKLRTQTKIKSTNRQRKSMLEQKNPTAQELELKLVKKMFNKPFNPFQGSKPSSRPPSTHYSQSNTSVMKTRPYQRCKMYEKLKMEINENHSFTSFEIQKQNQRKQKIQQQLNKLQQENLKNVVKQSLLFMASSTKNRKCKWIGQKKEKNLASNHLIQARFHSYSVNIDDSNIALSLHKSNKNLDSDFKIMRSVTETDAGAFKLQPEAKRPKVKRSYHRFESFVKNTEPNTKRLSEDKSSVFYRFPVM